MIDGMISRIRNILIRNLFVFCVMGILMLVLLFLIDVVRNS